MDSIACADAASLRWDAIVVGTGMGGATLGRELAAAGWKVLFCEQGSCAEADKDRIAGQYAEALLPDHRATEAAAWSTYLRAGRCFESIVDESRDRPRTFIPFVGAGAGGSSALYGMAMERFQPEDFTPGAVHPDQPGSLLPESWPIALDDLAPHYAAAESMFGVAGSRDPLGRNDAGWALREPPPLTPHGAEIVAHLERSGLHPYRLPLACGWAEGCNNCQGFLCPRGCKRHSGNVCLEPAVERFGASVVERCKVTRVRAERGEVRGVDCLVDGREYHFRCRVCVLAAGALSTPVILLRSASHESPEGLANGSGLVGRNLMRHLVDLVAVRTEADPGQANGRKEIAFNDWYRDSGGRKLGGVQSFGRLPPAGIMFAALEDDVGAGPWRWLLPGLRALSPFVTGVLRKLEQRHVLLASTVEDLPYLHNRVRLTSDGEVRFEYTPGHYDRERVGVMRRHLSTVFKGRGVRAIPQAENNQRLAHVCGTCRMGDDPRTSVVDAHCRSHEFGNLYIVDASCFVTSAGTNPSLTIAANALRVGGHLTGRHPPDKETVA